MSARCKRKLEARLRDGRDDDLIAAISDIREGDMSELVRDGMRLMLGIRTKKCIEVHEKQLLVPPPLGQADQKGAAAPTKPMLFKKQI
jgi:hypothetical protein